MSSFKKNALGHLNRFRSAESELLELIDSCEVQPIEDTLHSPVAYKRMLERPFGLQGDRVGLFQTEINSYQSRVCLLNLLAFLFCPVVVWRVQSPFGHFKSIF